MSAEATGGGGGGGGGALEATGEIGVGEETLYIVRRQSEAFSMKRWQKRSGSDAGASVRSGCAAIGPDAGDQQRRHREQSKQAHRPLLSLSCM
ncbi:MAG TPA: hypothetical protein VGC56_01435 [Allosphingosinicella sp.]|jgi:hypothetical protein